MITPWPPLAFLAEGEIEQAEGVFDYFNERNRFRIRYRIMEDSTS